MACLVGGAPLVPAINRLSDVWASFSLLDSVFLVVLATGWSSTSLRRYCCHVGLSFMERSILVVVVDAKTLQSIFRRTVPC